MEDDVLIDTLCNHIGEWPWAMMCTHPFMKDLWVLEWSCYVKKTLRGTFQSGSFVWGTWQQKGRGPGCRHSQGSQECYSVALEPCWSSGSLYKKVSSKKLCYNDHNLTLGISFCLGGNFRHQLNLMKVDIWISDRIRSGWSSCIWFFTDEAEGLCSQPTVPTTFQQPESSYLHLDISWFFIVIVIYFGRVPQPKTILLLQNHAEPFKRFE